jgi:hypothetical protein
MKARIEITFDSAEECIQVRESIDPDNSPLPEGIEIDTITQGAVLAIKIRCEKGIDSFRGTIEDIMSAIDLSVRVLHLAD